MSLIAFIGTSRGLCRQAQSGGLLFDGLGIGLGFTFALTLLGCIREFLGTGHVFGISVYPEEYGSLIFILAPGAFIALGFLIAIIHTLKTR